MPVKRKTINLSDNGNSLLSTDAITNNPCTDAGVSGEDCAVWLNVQIPADWQDLNCVLQVLAMNGNYDVSGVPVSNVINMPLRQGITVPGRLTISLIGTSSTGVRKSIDCRSLSISQSDIGNTLITDENPTLLDQVISNAAVAAVSAANALNNSIAAAGYVNVLTGVGGWTPTLLTFFYLSADTPTFSMTTPSDVTSFIYPGIRIKLTQSMVKYFIVTAVLYSAGVTTITMYGGTDFTLANSAISAVYFSNVKAPQGFPLDPTKWSVIFTDSNTMKTVTTTVANTWTNIGGLSLTVPIGIWNLKASGVFDAYSTAVLDLHVSAAMSGHNNVLDSGYFETIASAYTNATSGTCVTSAPIETSKSVSFSTKTIIYFIVSSVASGAVSFEVRSDTKQLILKAVCAYL